MTILSGTTKLPTCLSVEVLMYTIEHWLACLTQIRYGVDAADWQVHIDDDDAVWADDRWQMQ